MALNPVLTRTAAEIIESSLRRARIIPVRQPVSNIDFLTGINALNGFVAKLRSQGWHLWKTEEYVLFLERGKTDYFIGPSGDRAVFLDDLIQTTVVQQTPSGEQSIEVGDTSGFSGSDDVLDFDPASSVAGWSSVNADISISSGVFNISTTATDGYAQYEPIETEQGRDYFFQINVTSASVNLSVRAYSGLSETLLASASITTGETILNFTATEESVIFRLVVVGPAFEEAEFNSLRLRDTDTGEKIGFRVSSSLREWGIVTMVQTDQTLTLKEETANTSEVNQSVVAYKNLPSRPLKITNCRSKNALFDDEIPINTWTRQEYMQQTIKASQGLPTQSYYQPTLNNGRLYVWQTASDVNQMILFSGDTPLEITEENADNPDFPAEWFEMLSWGLAALIGPEYGIPDNRQAKLDSKAFEEKEDALDWDEESGSLTMGPSNGY